MHTEQQIESLLGQIKGGCVLDVATGRGSMVEWLVKTLADFTEIIGVDIHPVSALTQHDVTTFKPDNIHYQQMDAHQLAFPNAHFDTVTIMNGLHHMTDAPRVLSEMMRVLKPGGYLIVGEMYCDDLTPAQQTHVAIHHWGAEIDRVKGITHNNTYARAQIVRMFEALKLNTLTFYDYAALNTDPHDPQTIEALHKRIATIRERGSDLPNSAEIAIRAKDIAQQLDEIGFQSAPELFAIGTR